MSLKISKKLIVLAFALFPAFAFAGKKDCPVLDSYLLGSGMTGATVALKVKYSSSRKEGSTWLCTYTGEKWHYSIYGTTTYAGPVTFTIRVK